MSGSSSSNAISIVLISSDGERFKADYSMLESECGMIKSYYEVDEGDIRCYSDIADVYLKPFRLSDTQSKTLFKIIDYCMKHADKSVSVEYLRAYDLEFVKQKPRTLTRLLIAAMEMYIRSLIDLVCLAFIDIINEMSPEDIFKTLDITTDDFDYDKVAQMFRSYCYEFMGIKQNLTPLEFYTSTSQDKRMMYKENFMQKVLPALPPARFPYLTLEEKKEWVLAAVLRRHMNQMIACTDTNIYKLDPTNGEKEPTYLGQTSVRQEEESQSLQFDLTRMFVKESRGKKSGSKNPVFQLFSVSVNLRTAKSGWLYGLIEARGNGPSEFISFFNRGLSKSESQPVLNSFLVSLTDPTPSGFISATGIIDMNVQLFLHPDENNEDDEDLKLSLVKLFWDCSRPCFNNNYGNFEKAVINTVDASVKLCYMVLDNPVEATVKIDLDFLGEMYFIGNIVAYYGDLMSYFHPSMESNNEIQGVNFGTFKCDIEEVEYCKVTLFETSRTGPVLVKDGKFPLTRSRLFVPYGSSIVIYVLLENSHPLFVGNTSEFKQFDCKTHYIDEPEYDMNSLFVENTYEFKQFDCKTHYIDGSEYHMKLEVDWEHLKE